MIHLENLSKSFAGQVLFDSLTMTLPEGGNIALVGGNGAGKTTLLNIMCDLEESDSGKVILGRSRQIGYLPQEPNPDPKPSIIGECETGAQTLQKLKLQLEKALELMTADPSPKNLSQYDDVESLFRQEGGYSLTAKAERILTGLGFARENLDQDPQELSGGWRMRLELAKIFIHEPELLILDEPTNHLDLPSLAWVESWLQKYKGTLIFVSHDRSLLNRLANQTLHLNQGVLKLYKGNFDQFMEQKEAQMEMEQAQLAQLQRRRAEHEKFVERFGAKATKAKQAQSRVKMINRLRQLEAGFSPAESDASLGLVIPPAQHSGRLVLKVEDLAIGYQQGQPLATDINLDVEKGQKIAVIGANGIGKSTLIKTMARTIPALQGEVEEGHKVQPRYFAQDQHLSLASDKTLLENVLAATAEIGQLDARKLLGSMLFSGDDVFKTAGVLSGGEKNRLGMACMLAKKGNLLLMDEPTNHLDMTSVEVLIDGLQKWDGTLIFVSHDRNFINSLCSHVFVMLPDGRSRLFEGDLSDYQAAASKTGFPDVLQGDQPSEQATEPNPTKQASQTKVSHEEVKKTRQQKTKLERQQDKLEEKQELIKCQIQEIEDEAIKIEPSNFQGHQNLSEQRIKLEQELEENELLWLEQGEEIESLDKALKLWGRS